MSPAPQSRGTCLLCGYESTKGALSRHLNSCPARKAAEEKAAQSSRKGDTLFHLRVEDAYNPAFWLDLEVNGSAKLKDIDSYLRAIWLECCGHLSQFSFGGWGGSEISMSRRVEAVFASADSPLTHIYDFGTSSETMLRVVAKRSGVPVTNKPILLMARNQLPEYPCMKCDQRATHLCMECQYEEETSGLLCAKHVKRHPHKDYGEPIELVNSPRLGLCGYEGPADPPY